MLGCTSCATGTRIGNCRDRNGFYIDFLDVPVAGR